MVGQVTDEVKLRSDFQYLINIFYPVKASYKAESTYFKNNSLSIY